MAVIAVTDMTISLQRALDELAHPRPDRNARHGGPAAVVHRERQNSGLVGYTTRCGWFWPSDEVEFTDEPVTCLTCLRAAA